MKTSVQVETGEFGSLKEAADHKDALLALIKSQGWSILCGVLERQWRNRADQILLIPTGQQATPYEQEFSKGEVSALRTVGDLPNTLIEVCEAFISETPEEDQDA